MINTYARLRKYFEELEELYVNHNSITDYNTGKEYNASTAISKKSKENTYIAKENIINKFEQDNEKLIGAMSRLDDVENEIINSYFILGDTKEIQQKFHLTNDEVLGKVSDIISFLAEVTGENFK
jgi:DNA-directed RNA polymerase specialized sigma subunit